MQNQELDRSPGGRRSQERRTMTANYFGPERRSGEDRRKIEDRRKESM